MFEKIRDKMRFLVRSLDYVMTIRGEEETELFTGKKISMKIETMTCDNCGKTGARIIHVSRSYGAGDNLLVIENVPVISCPHCGESYLTAATLREIDNIKCNRSSIASKRPVPVAAFL